MDTAIKKIPYGMTNFESIISDNYYYHYIALVEDTSRFFFFVRPRRFGKSLFLNMLGIYYDINKQDKFEEIFGGLYIGKHPTPKISVRTTISYAILSTLTRLLEKMQVSFKR